MERWAIMCAVAFLAVNANGQSLTEAVATTLRTNPEILASRYSASAAGIPTILHLLGSYAIL